MWCVVAVVEERYSLQRFTMAPVTVDALTGSESMIEVLKVNYNLLLLIFFPSGRLWWIPWSSTNFCDVSKG